MKRITEQTSLYRDLEKMDVNSLLTIINQEDQTVAITVKNAIPSIEPLVNVIIDKLKNGGRLFYIGAGTSGRLGILDASECPPTYGVPEDMVIGLIAGGDSAIRKAVENAEDDPHQAWKDLQNFQINSQDVVIGIAASGTTPYVVNGLMECRKNKITTACITCNPDAPVKNHSDYPIEVVTGPEVVTGSTRMKAGTAQKLVLNMISTASMIGLGRVKDNKMVDMQLTNAKLQDRGTKMLVESLGISYDVAKRLLQKNGSVRKVMEIYKH
jgi:N-acetylmuramic acid 6-phosphate etherase